MYSNNLQMQEATGLKYNQVLILPIPLPVPSHKLLGLGDKKSANFFLWNKEINQLSLDILGYRALDMDPVEGGSPYRPDPVSAVLPRYLNNRAASIFGGSQEVQRNIIAKMVLGL